MSLIYETLNQTETTFNTSFCLPSHTTEYVLITTLATDKHIKYVTLTRETICDQIPYINNCKSAVPFEDIPPNIPKINKATNIILEHLNVLKFKYSHIVYVALLIILSVLLFMCIVCCCFISCCCCCYYKKKVRDLEAPIEPERGPIPIGELPGPNPV